MTYGIGDVIRLRGENIVVEGRRVIVTRKLGRVEYYDFIAQSGQRYGLTSRELDMNGATLFRRAA